MVEAEDGIGIGEGPSVRTLWETRDEVEGGEGEGGDVLCGDVWGGASGENGSPVGGGDGLH